MQTSQHFVTLSIKVGAPTKVAAGTVASLLKQLIDCGLEDAQATLASREGDRDSAKLACALEIEEPVVVQAVSSVPVKHWDNYAKPDAAQTHVLTIEDLRASHGQASITLSNAKDPIESGMCVITEVSGNPLAVDQDVACLRVHFDHNAVALSLFKIGNRFLMRSEGNVALEAFTSEIGLHGNHKGMYWLARDSQALMSDLAQEAFSNYQFGTGVEVTGADGWEYTTPGNEMVRKVYVETEREDDGPAPSWTLNFTVRFNEADCSVAEVYATDGKGQVWGSAAQGTPEEVPSPGQYQYCLYDDETESGFVILNEGDGKFKAEELRRGDTAQHAFGTYAQMKAWIEAATEAHKLWLSTQRQDVSPQSTRPEVKADADGAKLFFEELLASIESLAGIADDHGLNTLTDLMYLQQAILKGETIDVWPGETKVGLVVQRLPSADRWLAYTKLPEPWASACLKVDSNAPGA